MLVDDGINVRLGELRGEEMNFKLFGEVGVLVVDFSDFAAFGEGNA